MESNIEGDIYTINMTYRIAGISQLSGFKKFRMANRYYGHMWNGYEIPEPEDEEYIYVTENGRVYHTNRECTHIRLSVRLVEAIFRFGKRRMLSQPAGLSRTETDSKKNSQRGSFQI